MTQTNSTNPSAFNLTFATNSFRLEIALNAKAISLVLLLIKGIVFGLKLINLG